jgi:hypothetical protein
MMTVLGTTPKGRWRTKAAKRGPRYTAKLSEVLLKVRVVRVGHAVIPQPRRDILPALHCICLTTY